MVLEKFVQLQDIRVVKVLENADLRQQFSLFLCLQKLLVYYLHGTQGFSFFVQAFSDFPIRS